MNTSAPRPSADELRAAAGQTVRDVIAPDLRVLFVGINPSLYTAAVGHHFARPGNRFWKVLHLAGFTDRQLSPYEDDSLLAAGYGVTNVVARATATAAELDRTEIEEGGRLLVEKIERFRPGKVAVLGVGAYRTAFARPKATVGRQAEPLGDAELWVLPNPSGLQASYQLPDLVRLYGECLLA